MNENKRDQVNIYAVDGDRIEAGVVTYFRFSGEVDELELSDAADDNELNEDLLPELPSKSTAMTRAVDACKGKHTLVRAHEDGGYCIIEEQVEGEDIDFNIECRVKLDQNKTLIIEPANHPFADQIRADFFAHQKKYSTTDISKWLVKQLKRLDAVVLRDQGGVYFVPRPSKKEFQRIADTIRAASKHRIFELPALEAEATVEAVLDALTSEAEACATQMEQELLAMADEQGGKALGKRALGTRLRVLDGLKEKLKKYEQLLDVNLDSVSEKLEKVQANVALAKIAAETESDEEAA